MLKAVNPLADVPIENRLRQLSAEVDLLADRLAARHQTVGIRRNEPRDLINCTRHYLKQRRRRDALLGDDLFADPAWDILLDLFIRSLEGRRVSVSDACLGSGVPPTTALRWIRSLEGAGHVSRIPCEKDGRRVFLSLSEHSRTAIEDWISVTFIPA
jgi:DNA-binding transcriptional ArsR family regulator